MTTTSTSTMPMTRVENTPTGSEECNNREPGSIYFLKNLLKCTECWRLRIPTLHGLMAIFTCSPYTCRILFYWFSPVFEYNSAGRYGANVNVMCGNVVVDSANYIQYAKGELHLSCAGPSANSTVVGKIPYIFIYFLNFPVSLILSRSSLFFLPYCLFLSVSLFGFRFVDAIAMCVSHLSKLDCERPCSISLTPEKDDSLLVFSASFGLFLFFCFL